MNSSLYCFALLGLLIGTVWNDKKSENKSDFIILEQIPKCCPLDKVWDESKNRCQEGTFDVNIVIVWSKHNTSVSLAQTDVNVDALKHDPLTSEDCSGSEISVLDQGVDFRLLSNGDLLLPDVPHLYHHSPQEYCVEMYRSNKEAPSLHVAVFNPDKIVEESTGEMCEVRLVLFPFLLSVTCMSLCLIFS